QDRLALANVAPALNGALGGKFRSERFPVDGASSTLGDGGVAVGAITSCTNTSNPQVIVGAALLARNAAKRGLKPKPWVKTSFSPGSQVVADYLARSGLQQSLDQLGFQVVGYGCMTCMGNSGPLSEEVVAAAEKNNIALAAVLSGNRNFEGRIHPNCRLNYLASPPLVVAYAIAGTMAFDFSNDALGQDDRGNAVYLRDIWPSDDEIRSTIDAIV